jgi:ribosomal protein S27AE
LGEVIVSADGVDGGFQNPFAIGNRRQHNRCGSRRDLNVARGGARMEQIIICYTLIRCAMTFYTISALARLKLMRESGPNCGRGIELRCMLPDKTVLLKKRRCPRAVSAGLNVRLARATPRP